jgi:hypothetical protein
MSQTQAVIDLTTDSDLEDACNPTGGNVDSGRKVRSILSSLDL